MWNECYGLQIRKCMTRRKNKQTKKWIEKEKKINAEKWNAFEDKFHGLDFFFSIHRINHHHFTITTTTTLLLLLTFTTNTTTTISLWPVCCNYICLVKCPFSARLIVSTHKQTNKHGWYDVQEQRTLAISNCVLLNCQLPCSHRHIYRPKQNDAIKNMSVRARMYCI